MDEIDDEIDLAEILARDRDFHLKRLRKALAICREWAKSDPATYLPYVALLLHAIALRCQSDSMLFDNEECHQSRTAFLEAEEAYKEALELYREVARCAPATYQMSTSYVLNNFAEFYCYKQRFEEAEKLYREDLEQYRKLAESDPDKYQPEVASTLRSLARLYKRMDHPEEEATAVRDALELFRKLLERDHDKHEQDADWTWYLLYEPCRRMPPREEEKILKDYLELYRKLVESRPAEHYEPKLVESIERLAKFYNEMNRTEEARNVQNEADELRHKIEKAGIVAAKRLDSMSPDAYEIPQLRAETNPAAYAYNGLYRPPLVYTTRVRLEEEEKSLVEHLQCSRKLAESDPAEHQTVVLTLNRLAHLYRYDLRMEEAEDTYKKAVELCRRLAETKPAVSLSYLATSLNNLGTLYSRDRFKEAEDAFQEALAVQRRLAESNPIASWPDLAMILDNLASIYCSLHKPDAMDQTDREALDLYRKLAEHKPAVYLPYLAWKLDHMQEYSYYRDPQQTEKYLRERLSVCRKLAKTDSATYQSELAKTLCRLAGHASQGPAEGENAYREAIELYRALAMSNWREHGFSLAIATKQLADFYRGAQHWEDAEVALQESLAVHEAVARGSLKYSDHGEKVAVIVQDLADARREKGKAKEGSS